MQRRPIETAIEVVCLFGQSGSGVYAARSRRRNVRCFRVLLYSCGSSGFGFAFVSDEKNNRILTLMFVPGEIRLKFSQSDLSS